MGGVEAILVDLNKPSFLLGEYRKPADFLYFLAALARIQ